MGEGQLGRVRLPDDQRETEDVDAFVVPAGLGEDLGGHPPKVLKGVGSISWPD